MGRGEPLEYRDIVNSMPHALVIVDENLIVQIANLEFYKLFNLDEQSVLGQHFFDVKGNLASEKDIRPLLEAVIAHDISINRIRLEQTFPVIGRRVLNLAANRISHDGLPGDSMVIVLQDVTQARMVVETTAERLTRTRASIVEVNHRVKNNLASIRSMLRIEARNVTDSASQEVMERIGLRVESMARLYEMLTIGEIDGTIEITPYFRAICDTISEVANSQTPGWAIQVDIDPLKVDTDAAIALGAILNELVTNAAKYAFLGQQDIGSIEVSGVSGPEGYCLSVVDNGTGIDRGDADPKSTGMGMRLVDFYARSLDATFQHDSGPGGTTCRLDIPWSALKLEHDDLYLATDVLSEDLPRRLR